MSVTTLQPGQQARAKATCTFAMGAEPSRADREVGVQATQTCQVTAILVAEPGIAQYDANTSATLYGKVAGVYTRQNLTVSLDDTSGIAELTGFDPTTVWDEPPKVIITRWDGPGPDANFLGY